MLGVVAASTVVIDLIDGDWAEPWFLVVAIIGVLAGVTGGSLRSPGDPTTSGAMVAAMTFWLTTIAASSVVYLLVGLPGGFGAAFFESAAGLTTTAFTTLEGDDFSAVDRSILWWRAGSQLVGGLGALSLAAVILPFWGGGRELADPRSRTSQYRSLAPTPALGVRHIAELYGFLLLFTIVALMIAGVPWFDAVTFAMTTVSSGGFANDEAGVAALGSAGAEWILAAVMFAVGLSVAAAWWLLRGQIDVLWKSIEIRVYGAAVAIATIAFGFASADAGDGTATAIRNGFFAATSVVSTTGHRSADWATWGGGPLTLLLVLVAVGAMSGSTGGGYTWLRVIESLQYYRRELVRQVHPNAVITVKVGSRSASEQTIERVNAYFAASVMLVSLGVFSLALFGADLVTACSAAVSALSTFGPAFGDLAGSGSVDGVLSFGDQVVLVPLMIAGRLAMYPTFVALSAGGSATKRFVLDLRRDLERNGS